MGTLKEIENRYYKECSVVMLPTKDKSNILLRSNKELYYQNLNPLTNYKCQHLYITSDDEIKEGDWYYVPFSKSIKNTEHNKYQQKEIFKIIATTDKFLSPIIHEGEVPDESYPKEFRELILPQPSQSFIKKYCELGGIDKVLVEYYRNEESMMNNINTKGKKSSWLLKTDSHNNITIKPVKNSWNREELFKEIKTKYKCKNEIAFLNSFIKEL